jgi:hypothetical protein
MREAPAMLTRSNWMKIIAGNRMWPAGASLRTTRIEISTSLIALATAPRKAAQRPAEIPRKIRFEAKSRIATAETSRAVT